MSLYGQRRRRSGGRRAASQHSYRPLTSIPEYRKALPSGIGKYADKHDERKAKLRGSRENLTERNLAILSFVEGFGGPVAAKQIRDGTGLQSHQVSNDLYKLQQRDLILRTPDGWVAV